LHRLWLWMKIIYAICPIGLFLIPADEPSTRWNPVSESVTVSRGWLLSGRDARQPNPAFARWRHMSGRNVRQGASVVATVMTHVYHNSSRFPYGSDRSMGSTSGKKEHKNRHKKKGAQQVFSIVHDQSLDSRLVITLCLPIS
jgi:hypothetical protein